MLGSHIAQESRESPAFARNVLLLKSAVEAMADGAPGGGLDDEEVATAVGSMLSDTAPPAMLMQLHARAGDTAARIEWRQLASAWCKGDTR